jgi:hypothetical protein
MYASGKNKKQSHNKKPLKRLGTPLQGVHIKKYDYP